ncbi:MAG: manganese transporter [Gemmataceae bacterium]|nr:manganese transporter [Gemmataceae bacterium]
MATFPKFLALSLVLLAGCGTRPAEGTPLQNRKIQAVATTGMIADLVRNIGGSRVEVQALMGPGIDPHSYEPRESDINRLMGADVIFFNGLHLEGKMSDLFEDMGKKKPTLAVASALSSDEIRNGLDGNEQAPDPHIWFHVGLWKKTCAAVRDQLSKLDPSSASQYASQAEAYQTRLDKLHQYVQDQAKKIPEGQRVLITAHDAFAYFGQGYGFQVRGVQGISTVAEASGGEIADLARFMVKNRIHAYFVESSVPKKNLEKLKEVVRSIDPTFEIREGGELYSDALGPENSPARDYEGMVRHNIDTLVRGLLP